jgi:hypothetical protein
MNFNNFASNYIKGLNESNYNKRSSFLSLDEASVSINIMSGDSGFYTPKAIKINGLDDIYFLKEDGTLNYEFKVKENNGVFSVYEWTLNTFNDFEKKYSVAV